MTSKFKLSWQEFVVAGVQKLRLAVVVGILVGAIAGLLTGAGQALAETAEVAPPPSPAPAALFKLHCAGCHPSGGNIIRRGKNLKQRALARHGYDQVDAIATLITHGKGLMSAFGDKLSEDEIQALSQYVLDQAAVNWK